MLLNEAGLKDKILKPQRTQSFTFQHPGRGSFDALLSSLWSLKGCAGSKNQKQDGWLM
jgi:hypothetical protein